MDAMMERRKIGFVTGLKAEAALLRDAGFLVAAGGGEPAGAFAAAEALAGQGAEALVSFGLAGGLARALRPGTVLVPTLVLEGPREYPCDPALMRFLGGPSGQRLLAGHRIAAAVADKAALFRRSRADAIDLESGAVARVASARGLRFAVLRAIADPAERALPPAALVPLRADGGIALGHVLRSVALQPAQIPALLRLARDAGSARKALVARLRALAATAALDPA
ncbi:MAG: hypothetical protein B7Z80_03120 [Rhodospirillales bacterium 20-64-7]|nr:MAG: hypothetical protein B7Z80_03120 [Rhodospirillales bacterium 20-64-7]